MKKTALILILSFLFLYSENALAKLPKSFQQKKPELLRKFTEAGISKEFAEKILSDKRLAYYQEFFEATNNRFANPPDFTHGIFKKESIRKSSRVAKEEEIFLDKACERYGVPAEYLVSIYWIETRLGVKVGRHKVVNSLLTWTLSGTKRADWAEKELVAFVQICYQQKFDPFSIVGSWAGAFGKTQFIPSSYVSFAVDGNGDGKIDLFDFPDAMFSTANYLYRHGWNRNDPKKIKKAIYAYNHDADYVNLVEIFASFIKYSNIICEGG